MESGHKYSIAVTGAVSTGKTTLAKSLAEALGLPLIAENFDGNITRRREKTADEWSRELRAVLLHKTRLEMECQHFVADRSPIDLVNSWYNNMVHRRLDEAETDKFMSACANRIRVYSYVIITPWGSIPMVQVGDDRPGIARNLNKFSQFRQHTNMLGITHCWVDKRRIIEIPRAMTNHEDRVEFVLRAIEKREQLLRG